MDTATHARDANATDHTGGSAGRYTVPLYLGLVFLYSWSVWLLAIPRTNGAGQVLVVLAGAWGPTLVAVVLTAATDGWGGVMRLLGRLVRWRVPLRWYAVALFAVPATTLIAVGIGVAAGGDVPTVTTPGDVGLVAVPLVFLVNVFVGGPLAEELGWRGYALPALAGHVGARTASVGVGLAWALWHLPFFWWVSGLGVTAGFPLWAYVPVLVAWSVIVSWVVVESGWSVLLAVIFHASVNTTLGTLAVVDVADTGVLAAFVVVQVGVAAVVAVVAGRSLSVGEME